MIPGIGILLGLVKIVIMELPSLREALLDVLQIANRKYRGQPVR